MFFLLMLVAYSLTATGQATKTISGTVTDNEGTAIPGVTVSAKGGAGVTTDAEGKFTLQIPEAVTYLTFSFVGYATQDVQVPASANITVMLQESASQLDEIVIIGSHASGRTVLETPVPVDIIDLKELYKTTPQISISQILNYVAPSFSSNAQSIQDGTDHIDPASLRGMGVDQVLVLLNGKRLHQTSLVNFQVGPGRGQVGTDLNQIPVSAISKIEILRDGAAAQYGSDAIAGVINIILKETTGVVEVTATTGAYFTGDESLKQQDKNYDGQQFLTTFNYGIPLNDKGGFINFSGSIEDRKRTNRATDYEGSIFRDYNATDGNGNLLYDVTQFSKDATDDNALAYFQANNLTGADITDAELVRRGTTRRDYTMYVGQAQLRDAKGYFNAVLPINENFEFYAFGGIGFRQGRSSGYSRLPSNPSRYLPELYKDGFLPHINSKISDKNFAVGIRGKSGEWNVDFSNIYGSNQFLFIIDQSINFSQLTASQTSFDAGGHAFSQNTTNFDLSRKFDILKGLNIAFGAEHRYENFKIIAGEEASWRNYGLDANNQPTVFLRTPTTDENGDIAVNTAIRPGGSQVFPGFQSAVNQYRNSYAFYGDVELDVTEKWLLGAAIRYENYSDFGGTTNYKAVTRYKLGSNWTARASFNTGFRAPSLHQVYFQTTTTQLVNGTLSEVGIFSNTSKVAQILGLPKLKAEQSQGFTGGVTGTFLDNFSLSLDYFLIKVKDRIVFTDAISGDPNGTPSQQQIYNLLLQANASVAQFFVNAIDTKTQGVDAVLSYTNKIGAGSLKVDLAATFSQTKLDGKVKVPATFTGNENFFFPKSSQTILENISPVQKQNLILTYSLKKWSFFLRNVRFGKVIDPNIYDDDNNYMTFQPKVITDLSIGYNITKGVQVTVGSNNLLDIYPSKVDKVKYPGGYDDGRFRYQNAASQFGYNGRFLFARLNLTL
ncbi:TonB-dependent receptor [Ohtaekwangia koreensis]|nr:TonB-dependent receptor [Ohtaekwangia koreensis]